MELGIIKNKKDRMGIIQGIILVLFGIFVSTMLFAIIIKIFGQETYSLWIGIIVNILLAAAGLYFAKSRTIRLITYSMIGTLIVGTILFIVLIQITQNMLDGF